MLPHCAFSRTQRDQKKADERRCRICIREEEEEVSKYLNSVLCKCGTRFSIAQMPSKERKNIRSGHTTGRCPECVKKRELELNEMTCECGATFSIAHLPQKDKDNRRSGHTKARCPSCEAEQEAKKRKREEFKCGVCEKEFKKADHCTENQIANYRKGLSKILCKTCKNKKDRKKVAKKTK